MRILLTYARSPVTLDLARLLNEKGHTIITCDTFKFPICRFSNTLDKCYEVPSPRFDTEGYIESIVKIVKDEQIDYLIPMFEESLYIAENYHRFPKECYLFCPSFESLKRLHNKWDFYQTLENYGAACPFTQLITDKEELDHLERDKFYIIKHCYTRGAQFACTFVPGNHPEDLPISKSNPFIVQEWVSGKRYCTYSICHKGKIYAHCVYPVAYAIEKKMCFYFTSMEHPEILSWIEDFVKKENFTGQIGFDFIETSDKTLYAIDCNPRSTSGLHLFKPEDGIVEAILKERETLVTPQVGRSKQIAAGMLMYGWNSSGQTNIPGSFFKDFLNAGDVVFNRKDIKPFILQMISVGYFWKNSITKKLSLPRAFTYDCEWNG